MPRSSDFFSSDEVMVLFTTSPAGLGHIRVTEALREGLPETVRPEVMGIDDKSIKFIHRVGSRNRTLKMMMELAQNNPLVENYYVAWFRKKLRRETQEVYERVADLVARRRPKPKILVIIATHHSLAHKMAAIKGRLARSLGVDVVLAVVVTDDTYQKIWGVYGADYIFLPSDWTRECLEQYLRQLGWELPKLVVSAYPVSPKLARYLDAQEFKTRQEQVKAGGKEKLAIIMPISGAAVQLAYFEKLIVELSIKPAVRVTMVSRESSYTKEFLDWCQNVPAVEVVADREDREVVLSYEKELTTKVFAVEITKPSEQTFKTLLSPKQRGGVVLLFSEPVGRQEYDNLAFLLRHGLIPNEAHELRLNRFFIENDKPQFEEEFLKMAQEWRGLKLPNDGEMAGRAIDRLKESGILARMVDYSGDRRNKELDSQGVDKFWQTLAQLVSKQYQAYKGSLSP